MQITVNQREVQVEIPEDKILELESLSLDILASNVTSCKVLRSYVGKAMYIASTIYTWRPFLSQLFAALFPAQGTNAPKGCVWTQANCYAYQVDLGILTFASLPSCQDMGTSRTTDAQDHGLPSFGTPVQWDSEAFF